MLSKITIARGCRHPLTAMSVVSLALLAGCGRGSRNEVAQVRGLVTLDGKRYLNGGSVIFQPKSMGKMATGEIKADGTYELSTYSPGDGASIGTNLVMIMPKVTPIDELTEGVGAAATNGPFPKKYESIAGSGLSYEVKAGQVNEFDIELQTK